MAGQLVFSEENAIRGNIFKFEERLHTQATRYVEGGGIFSTYFNLDKNCTTVDRGTQDADMLFGKKSPLRWNQINDLPLYQFPQTNPENTDENQIEDINVTGECQIIPGTIVPTQNDFFIINHVKMTHIFAVTEVHYDSMKPDGYYKISYRLYDTNPETIEKIKAQCIQTYHTEMRDIGTSTNPIVKEEDYLLKRRIEKMTYKMIDAYHGLYYNDRHNCYLYRDHQSGVDWFDFCGNEFMAKYALANRPNASRVIVLGNKLQDTRFPMYNNDSIYNWLEMGCPIRMLQKFHFRLVDATAYPTSSFALWADREVNVMIPISTKDTAINNQEYSYFDGDQLGSFMDPNKPPLGSEYEKLIWNYIHKGNQISLKDVSLYTADALLGATKNLDTFLYTPICVYIIRQILAMN